VRRIRPRGTTKPSTATSVRGCAVLGHLATGAGTYLMEALDVGHEAPADVAWHGGIQLLLKREYFQREYHPRSYYPVRFSAPVAARKGQRPTHQGPGTTQT
jgi:hypothetical protein